MITNHQYKIWKKESPDNYDFIISHSLEWPSFTFQWLPEVQTNDDIIYYYAVIASSNADADQSQLLKIKIQYPNEAKAQNYLSKKNHKITVEGKINHTGQINRARHCHADSKIVAVSTSKGDICLTTFDQQICKLVGHTAQGYGLSWNSINKNLLLSGFSDKRLCIWDIASKPEGNKRQPIFQILHHSAPIEDVAWHKFHPNVFSSCSDDRVFNVWDMRFRNSGAKNQKKPIFQVLAHTDQVYTLDFSPFNQFLLVSGSADQNVSIWDLRNLTRAIQTLPTAKNSVMKVQWSPFTSSILASCGYGRNVDLWDLSKQKREGQPLYMFRHMGHRSRVLDLDWHPIEKMLIASVQQNNCLQIWQMNRNIYYEDEQGAK